MTTHSRQMASASYNNARMRYPMPQDDANVSQQRSSRGVSEERRSVGKYGTGRPSGMASPTALRAMLDERTVDEEQQVQDMEMERRSRAYNNSSGRGPTQRMSGTDPRMSRNVHYDPAQLPPATPKRQLPRPITQQDMMYGSGRYNSGQYPAGSRGMTQQIKTRRSVEPQDNTTMVYQMNPVPRGLRPRQRNYSDPEQVPVPRYLKGDEELEPYSKDIPFEVISSPPEQRPPVSRGDMSYQYHALNTTPEDSSTDDSELNEPQQCNADWTAQQEYTEADLQHTDSLTIISKRGSINNQPQQQHQHQQQQQQQQEKKKLGLCPKDSLSLISERLRIRKDSTPKSYSTNTSKYDDWEITEKNYRKLSDSARRSTETYYQTSRQLNAGAERAKYDPPIATSSNTRNPREVKTNTPRSRAVPCRPTMQYCEPRRDVVSRIVRHGTKSPPEQKKEEIQLEGQALPFISRVSVPSTNSRDKRDLSSNRAHSRFPLPVWRLYNNEE